MCLPCRREAHKRWREQHKARELAGEGIGEGIAPEDGEASGTASSEPAGAALSEIASAVASVVVSEALRAGKTIHQGASSMGEGEGEGIEPASMRPCARCGVRPRYVSPLSGRRYVTCLECKRADNTAWRKGKRDRIRASEGEGASSMGGAAPPVGATVGELDGRELDGRELDGRELDGRELDGRELDGRDDPPAGEPAGEAEAPGRELAPVELADAPALTSLTPEDGERLPRASDIPGVLADMLLLLDRSREAIGRGEIDALRLAVDVRGVRVHMATESIGREHEE